MSDGINDMMAEIKHFKENVYDIEFDGIDHKDYPDYCDAYISKAMILDRECDQTEIDILNDDREFVYEKLMLHLY